MTDTVRLVRRIEEVIEGERLGDCIAALTVLLVHSAQSDGQSSGELLEYVREHWWRTLSPTLKPDPETSEPDDIND
ncbi:MAG TPA: hypothetical protein VNN80_23750 [Polyangiaceae bacterium]|nr:hypothetical protein [Polyangiaceae bacterium]